MAAALAEAKTALEGANAARVVEVAAAKTGPGHVAAASRAKRAEAQTKELRARLTEAEQAAQRAAAEAQRARAEAARVSDVYEAYQSDKKQLSDALRCGRLASPPLPSPFHPSPTIPRLTPSTTTLRQPPS